VSACVPVTAVLGQYPSVVPPALGRVLACPHAREGAAAASGAAPWGCPLCCPKGPPEAPGAGDAGGTLNCDATSIFIAGEFVHEGP
jgi:hypothetical protein